MRIGCGTVAFRTLPLKDALNRIKKAGYKYVETQATGPFCPHVDVDRDDPKKFKKLIEYFGFEGVTALWSTHGAIIPDELSLEYVDKCIRWAKEANIPVVNIGDGMKPEDMSEDEAWEILEERLIKILNTAEENETYLAIEPHGTFSLTSEGLERIMCISKSKWLGINYDTANIHRAVYVETKDGTYMRKLAGEKKDEVTILKEIVKRVVHVHVKDVKGTECVALGTGEVNIKG